MEKIIERKREPEPVHTNRNIEEMTARLVKEREKVALLPRVLRAADTNWTVGIQAFRRMWVSMTPAERFSKAPVCTMALMEQILEPGMKGGRHRHVREAIFYIIEGEGYEIHDDKRYDWSAGDIMTVPSYCDHQHFNPSAKQQARMWFSIAPLVEYMGIHWIEQIEMRSNYSIPPDAEPIYGPDKKVAGYRTKDGQEFKLGFSETIQGRIRVRPEDIMHIEKPRDTYELYMKRLEEQLKWRLSVPHVVRNEEVPWEDTRMGRIKFFIGPHRDGGLKTYDAFVQELPPGGASGRHRHAAEEVHKILEGKGYEIHDGVRHDWDAEDVVCIPPYVVHQHFNRDPHHPARFVAFQSGWYNFIGHGGIDHLEDAKP
ncbi:MAG: cupin domain-containing protein [Chloroflexi bacterium]|nr:cupin domain-containing protein [Chloroflexota bacterium]